MKRNASLVKFYSKQEANIIYALLMEKKCDIKEIKKIFEMFILHCMRIIITMLRTFT